MKPITINIPEHFYHVILILLNTRRLTTNDYFLRLVKKDINKLGNMIFNQSKVLTDEEVGEVFDLYFDGNVGEDWKVKEWEEFVGELRVVAEGFLRG